MKYFTENTFKLENFEISRFDFIEKLNWKDSDLMCKKLGTGWRLPNLEELRKILKHKNKISDLNNAFYWSSDIESTRLAYGIRFSDGHEFCTFTQELFGVRAVRNYPYESVTTSKVSDSQKDNIIQIGDIEILDKDFGLINWAEANRIIKDLNNNWKLPSKEEFLMLHKKKKLLNLDKGPYWSSLEYYSSKALIHNFSTSYQEYVNKTTNYRILLIRHKVA